MNTKRLSKEPIAFDMIPMVDVVLILLIFFMLISTFLPFQAIEVDLPHSTEAGELPSPPHVIVITITDKEDLYIEGERITWEQLPKKIREKVKIAEDKKALIRADKNLPLQAFVQLMDILQGEGIEEINLMTISEKER